MPTPCSRRGTPTVKLVYVCSPNNPTGNLIPRDAILAPCARARRLGLLVVDEAYIEWSRRAERRRLVRAHSTLAVLRTLSKAHAPGRRARAARCSRTPEIIELLRRSFALLSRAADRRGRVARPRARRVGRCTPQVDAAREREYLAARLARACVGRARVAERRQFPADRFRDARSALAREPAPAASSCAMCAPSRH